MTISLDEVRHIAALARLGISDERVKAFAVELNDILVHMQALAAAETGGVADEGISGGRAAMPLRPDHGPAIALDRAPDAFAPSMREGFFLVPRLATHEDSES